MTKRFYWTKELISKEAKKYKSKQEFHKKSGSAYVAAIRLNILEKVCSHMKQLRKEKGYWNKINIKKEAKRYTRRKDFLEQSSGAYSAARKNGILDKVCAHMIYRWD